MKHQSIIMRICPKCHSSLDDSLRFCTTCGTKLNTLDQLAVGNLVKDLKDLKCPKCGFENSEVNSFCVQCGTMLHRTNQPMAVVQPAVPNPNVCTNCGFENKSDALFCIECGTKLNKSNQPTIINKASPTPVTHSFSSNNNEKNTRIIVGVVILLLVVVVIGLVASSGSGNDDQPSGPTVPVWEADQGSSFNYSISGTYRNTYDPTSPHSVSGNMKTSITSCTSSTLSSKSTGTITISGIGSDSINSSDTTNRSMYKQTSSTVRTISTNYGQKECYVFVTKTSSAVYNDITITVYRGVSDGVMYKQEVNQRSTAYGSTIMSCDLSYYLTSCKITKYNG